MKQSKQKHLGLEQKSGDYLFDYETGTMWKVVEG